MLRQGGQKQPRPCDLQQMQLQFQSSNYFGMKPTQFTSWMNRSIPIKLAKIKLARPPDQRQVNPKDHLSVNLKSTRKLTDLMQCVRFTNLKTAWKVTTTKLSKKHLTKTWSLLAIRNLYRLLSKAKVNSMLSK